MNPGTELASTSRFDITRLKLAAVVLTLAGAGLFAYFVYAVGFWEIFDGVKRFGIAGFAVILAIYFGRILVRALAWKLSVHEPYSLKLSDTIPAVIIGEALSSTIPVGIMISGTSKAIVVRKKVPLVVGLSSVATENLFYSLVTGLFLIAGAVVLLRGYVVEPALVTAIYVLIAALALLLALGILMVIRQWHAASAVLEWIYGRGMLPRLLETGRVSVRRFEDLIYGFYRRHPSRFVPICLLEAVFHTLGVTETLFIISRLSDTAVSPLGAFLLESISRLVTILFKLIPFVLGVDEAGAQFVGETIGLAAGIGVTLAIIRKGRILFWVAVGFVLIFKKGLNVSKMRAVEEVS